MKSIVNYAHFCPVPACIANAIDPSLSVGTLCTDFSDRGPLAMAISILPVSIGSGQIEFSSNLRME